MRGAVYAWLAKYSKVRTLQLAFMAYTVSSDYEPRVQPQTPSRVTLIAVAASRCCFRLVVVASGSAVKFLISIGEKGLLNETCDLSLLPVVRFLFDLYIHNSFLWRSGVAV